MIDTKRLIENAFPLEAASLDSMHEKNVRHGHISTLHIWPARRPLAASRAALVATLLPDPVDPEKRRAILERLAGRVIERPERKRVGGRVVEVIKRETKGGILHWGRESGPDLDWFRAEIHKAYGGRSPRVLDPFAGGGAIPLEAMRLGCDATAIDINPVAWLILKCTLEYPQKLGGQPRPLPPFALHDRRFAEAFLKATGHSGHGLRSALQRLGHGTEDAPLLEGIAIGDLADADLAWHVRAWGHHVLAAARQHLCGRYPTYAEFQPLQHGKQWTPRPMQRIPTDDAGILEINRLNAEFDTAWLADPRNPRWVAKPAVAYLWARTVACKACRATLPLLKTRWLCKKESKRVQLTMEPNAARDGVVFGVEQNVQLTGGNAAQRREADKRSGMGTMSRAGAKCPCCSTINTMEDIRLEGRAARLGAVMTAVVVDGHQGKEYRLPTEAELAAADVSEHELQALYADIPFGLPSERLAGKEALGFRVPLYGFDRWHKLFTQRQLYMLGVFVTAVRQLPETLRRLGYPEIWREAIVANLALVNDRLADRSSSIAHWDVGYEKVANTFTGFRLPISWDFAETAVLSDTTGSYAGQLEWVARYIEHGQQLANRDARGLAQCASAIGVAGTFDVVVTDPPYYDAIPYSDLMDFFYVWLRRSLHGLSPEIDAVLTAPLGPKWDHVSGDGELIDDASRFGGDKARSKANYEEGMARAFRACHDALAPEGRLVVVFANKSPDAWETLVSALIRSGFVVDGSWPIQTEMGNRTRAFASAALSSSVWLVCRKRPATARPGFDTQVLAEMKENIERRCREFWDAGIRGPDFVWAATGPALEAFSRHPVVRKTTAGAGAMTVPEFLREVRRLVVDFVVGRVLSRDGASEAAEGLDDATTYYLLHRNDFGMNEAPIGAAILYALSCGIDEGDLERRYDLLVRSGATERDEQDEAAVDHEEESDSGGGSKAEVRLKPWHRRRGRGLGLEGPGGRLPPLIDQVHRLMQLWRAGDEVKVDEYVAERGLGQNALFAQVVQALIELSENEPEERTLLEALSNHLRIRGGLMTPRQGMIAV